MKIGQSSSIFSGGAADLYTTGVPEPFRVERTWYIVDVVAVERAGHAAPLGVPPPP